MADGSLPKFDQSNPKAFYLGDNWEEMAALSDAVLVVAGVELPVHSQVLSMQSSVLRGMFVEFLGTGSRYEDTPVGRKRKAEEEHNELTLEEPLAGCSLFEAALFLRLCYRPQELTPANLARERGSLPALLRLADKLDAQRILQATADCMKDAPMPSTEEAVTWIDAAEQCQQTELRLACVSRLVQQLVGKEPAGRVLAAGIADAALLEGCNKSTLLLLLGLVTGAVRQLAPRTQLLAYQAPSSGAIATALQHAASSGSYEWRIEHFSQQPAQVGSKLSSPWFVAGGREWQLMLHPNGVSQENAGHLSMYILPKQASEPVSTAVTFMLCDQTGEQPVHHTKSYEHAMRELGRSFPQFISLQQLRARPGYLAGDTLVIRAEVAVLQWLLSLPSS